MLNSILDEDGSYVCGHEIEKMSKSKFNVQTPDELVEKYGADTLRCYEMFWVHWNKPNLGTSKESMVCTAFYVS